MKRLIILLAALGTLLLFQTEALATHFRYGTINWVVPNPQTAPNAVEFTVTYAVVLGSTGTLQQLTLNFGDNTNNGAVAGPIIGTGTDAGGQQYEVREFTANHTYAAAGTYTAFFQDCCRINGLVNGAGGNYRVETKVVLQPGNTSGPVSASPPVIQLQLGGTRAYTWPVLDPDGDPVACRLATDPEAGFTGSIPVVPNPPGPGNGGQSPVLTTVPNGCNLSWDLVDAVAGQRYVLHLVFESTHSGQLSNTALDLIVEIITPPPPQCAGSSVIIANVGQAISAMVTGTHNLASNLTPTTINAPLGSTLTPAGAGLSPLTKTFSWTPQMADQGTTNIVLVNYTNVLNHTGTCFLTIQVPQCANYGAPCTSGVGQCAVNGTNVCAGPGQTVCGAIAGTPTTETCDGLDNDCNGTADDGNPGSAAICMSGLPGVCSPGQTNCQGGSLVCVPNVMPGSQMEVCDTLDNDCDGAVDDGLGLGAPCDNGLGACQTNGQIVCDGSGGTTCNASPGLPSEEVCGDSVDQDCDGVLDNGCVDTDGDGLFDDVELAIGTNPNDADSDDDGVADGAEPSLAQDFDGDGLINALDPDSDDDGLYDGTELGLNCANPATNVALGHCIADADGGATKTDPLDPDTDNGGVSDGGEDANHNGAIDAGETNPTEGNGADDITAPNNDIDGDGLTNAEETANGTDPNDADSDDDGVADGAEPNWADDTDGDGLINALDPDSDNDGLYDGTELGLGCGGAATNVAADHCIADADGGATKTNPLIADTDGGGVVDGSEDQNHNGVVDGNETDPTAGNGADDVLNEDKDGDGLTDEAETLAGTDPNDADSDDDGVIDGAEANWADDTDGDGLINALDPDSDEDGLFDGTEVGVVSPSPDTVVANGFFVADADPTTKTSPLLADTDGGGALDGAEDTNHNGKVDPGERNPTAGNGADDTNNDTDGDGLTNAFELSIGTDPNDADTDDDGVGDGTELQPGVDTDGDGLVNAADPDSDNDGLFDGTEMGVTTPNADTNLSVGAFIPDADPNTKTNPLDADTDDGGVNDGAEDVNLNGAVDAGETDPTVGNGADDSPMDDGDGDGLSDEQEDAIGTDPDDADSDDDGVIDGQEANPTADTDGDGYINALDPDSDDDGLFDGTEVGVVSPSPDTVVANGFFIPDADPGTKTSPLLADTDGGGAIDGAEDSNHNGKVDAGERNPTAGNGADDFDDDADDDGLTDSFELMIGTNPNDADTDDDGVPDGLELQPGVDTDGDGLVNAADPDSDNDGLFDGTEMGVTTPSPDTNLATGAFIPDADPNTETNPLDADTDGGSVSDGAEDVNHNGKVDGAETNPTVGNGADDVTTEDFDMDGLTDEQETFIGTDPKDADSDNDGVLDGLEPNPIADTDGDGLINALDPDSDGDGLKDGTEMGKDCSNKDTDVSMGNCIPDGDAGATTTSPVIADTDGGTVSDGDEDKNKNGVVDAGETNPTKGNGADDLQPMPECLTDADCGDATSGIVCDPITNICIDGCHTPGNGCPNDEVCTSDDATIGQCVECIADAQCGNVTSGLVCDPKTNACIQGCRTGGNGCPNEQTCTFPAESSEIGECKATEKDEEVVVAEGSGLICAARPSNDNGSSSPWLLAMAVGSLLAARRRRR